jgi:hypothetical protein
MFFISPGPTEIHKPIESVGSEWVSYNIPFVYFSVIVDLTEVFQFNPNYSQKSIQQIPM